MIDIISYPELKIVTEFATEQQIAEAEKTNGAVLLSAYEAKQNIFKKIQKHNPKFVIQTSDSDDMCVIALDMLKVCIKEKAELKLIPSILKTFEPKNKKFEFKFKGLFWVGAGLVILLSIVLGLMTDVINVTGVTRNEIKYTGNVLTFSPALTLKSDGGKLTNTKGNNVIGTSELVVTESGRKVKTKTYSEKIYSLCAFENSKDTYITIVDTRKVDKKMLDDSSNIIYLCNAKGVITDSKISTMIKNEAVYISKSSKYINDLNNKYKEFSGSTDNRIFLDNTATSIGLNKPSFVVDAYNNPIETNTAFNKQIALVAATIFGILVIIVSFIFYTKNKTRLKDVIKTFKK